MPQTKLKVDLIVDDKGSVVMKNFSNKTESAMRQVLKPVQNLTGGLSGLHSVLLSLAGGYGLARVASSALDVASGFEGMEIKLDALTRGKGTETLERMNAWALDMPVNTRGAVDAFTMMTAMGLDPTIEKMTTLVDVSSIFGEDTMPRVARALGQMQTQGKLSAEELNQMAEAGINARKYITEAFGMTVEEVQKSGIAIEKIVDSIWQGLDADYSGAAQAAMKSWAGLTATFESYMTEIARVVMDAGIFDELKNQLAAVNDQLKTWLEANRDIIAQEVPKYINRIKDALAGIWDYAKDIDTKSAGAGLLGWALFGPLGGVAFFDMSNRINAIRKEIEATGKIEAPEKNTLLGWLRHWFSKDVNAEHLTALSAITTGFEKIEDVVKTVNKEVVRDTKDTSKDLVRYADMTTSHFTDVWEDFYIYFSRDTRSITVAAANDWENFGIEFGAVFGSMEEDTGSFFDDFKQAWVDALDSPETTYDVVKNMTSIFVNDMTNLLGDTISSAIAGDMDKMKGYAREAMASLGAYMGQIAGSVFGPVGAAIGGAIGKGIGDWLGEQWFGESTKYAEVGAAIARWTAEGFIVNFQPTGSDADEWGSKLAKQLNEAFADHMEPFNETFETAIEIDKIPGIDSALADFQKEFKIIYESGFEGFSISEKGNWAEDFQKVMTAIENQWDVGVREMLTTLGFETYEEFMAFVEKVDAQIKLSASTIGGAFRAGLDTGEWADFEKNLYGSIYNQVLDAMIEALMKSELFRQALVPFFEAMDDAMDSLYDPAIFEEKMRDAIGVLKAGVGALKPQFDTISTTIASIKEILGLDTAQSFHGGGMVMHGGGMIPKAHSGLFLGPKLMPDERPIIAQVGEGVLSRRGMGAIGGESALAAANRGSPMGGGDTYNITFGFVTTNDVDRFLAERMSNIKRHRIGNQYSTVNVSTAGISMQ